MTPESSERARRARSDPEAYLERIGVDPETVETADLQTLERIQRAHVTRVPFENLAIVGDPYADRAADGDAKDGEGVVLSTPHLYEKVVERRRGGYCFELNGLFHALLADLGYDVDRVAARVVGDDGDARPPANHHANVVELDRRYVVDVGMGVPTMRRPTPLDGTPNSDSVGVEWRIAESDRPDETYRSEYRNPGDEEWSTRYVFSDVARELHYFEATNDYLQSDPDSPFRGDPVVSVATEEGHRKLSSDTLTEYVGGDERERTVTPEEWHATLKREFGFRYDRG
ncbi:arylamine N-acetyltransferase family protein [Halorussus amylolyticus]|uniref:arylamine N-acetyltransferase family protein n=1 Tax=Halorussus amylolyticus TaxID=1126242 RepID=UPI001044B03A|nr:arylamine N-acetyltransferase [Halorussus amylolyticus]